MHRMMGGQTFSPQRAVPMFNGMPGYPPRPMRGQMPAPAIVRVPMGMGAPRPGLIHPRFMYVSTMGVLLIVLYIIYNYYMLYNVILL